MRRRRADEEGDREIAELAALADGSLAPERRAALEAQVAASSELAARLAEQERAVSLTRSAAATPTCSSTTGTPTSSTSWARPPGRTSCATPMATPSRSASGGRGIVVSRVAGGVAKAGQAEAVCEATGGLERC